MDTHPAPSATTQGARVGTPDTAAAPSPQQAALHFYLCLADRSECEQIDRFLRHRQLAADILEAARRADAALRLDKALKAQNRRAA